MKRKLSRIISVLLAVIMCFSAMPVFASSVGSVSTDKNIGYDDGTGAITTYDEFSVGSDAKTDVYLTVGNGDVTAGVPTCIILDGKAVDGQHKGDYQVYVEGNIAGDWLVNVEPDKYDIELGQMGKDNVQAIIEQNKTAFTADEIADGTTADGTVIAQGLTAGSWSSAFDWIISSNENPYYTTSKIEYFTWGPDAEFIEAYNAGDISGWKGLAQDETVGGCSYAYPSATGITGLTDAGLQWLKDNGGNLILPNCATEVSDAANPTEGAFSGMGYSEKNEYCFDKLKSVMLPDSVTYIGDYAFSTCINLVSVDIGRANYIGRMTFANCESLTTIDLKNTVETIGKSGMAYCNNLKTVYGANAVKTIGYQGFLYCRNLESIETLSSIESVGENAFCYTYNLVNLGLSEDITSIGNFAFEHSNYTDDWAKYKNCTFGTRATTLQNWPNGFPVYNVKTSNNEVFGFSQSNEKWANIPIGGTNKDKTFNTSGCGWCFAATAYNYYHNGNLTPVDLVDKVKNVDVGLLYDGSFYNRNSVWNACGLKVTQLGSISTSASQSYSVQTIIDALADGKLVGVQYAPYGSGGHIVMIYGMNSDGEFLCTDESVNLRLRSHAIPDFFGITGYKGYRGNDAEYFTIRPESFLSSYDSIVIVDKL